MTCADAAPRTPKALLVQHQAGHSATPFPRGSPKGRTVGTRALPTDLGREASSVDTESSTPLKLPVAAPHSSTPEP